ncbi:MAG: hypothetical protein Faunusvirus45_8 [Faunusvirus sp.]|jgi:hypothetical protein|uniref:Uncharacterized protein n=1 Tax=Faunusvirus sp. TaxID=2487766 RepID=A0A3G4ZXV7_9VIRU|nr:MAG: hypothetical protein Faunusvirus45_8 [Faunusvirus sp.]
MTTEISKISKKLADTLSTCKTTVRITVGTIFNNSNKTTDEFKKLLKDNDINYNCIFDFSDIVFVGEYTTDECIKISKLDFVKYMDQMAMATTCLTNSIQLTSKMSKQLADTISSCKTTIYVKIDTIFNKSDKTADEFKKLLKDNGINYRNIYCDDEIEFTGEYTAEECTKISKLDFIKYMRQMAVSTTCL